MKTSSVLRCLLLAAAPFGISQAAVQLPAIFSDHMVLEKSDEVPVWGTADPGESVTVTLDEVTAQTEADASGKWMLALDLSESPQGPFEMTVQGDNTLRIADVVVGEVWVASGQSNMEFVVRNSIDASAIIADSANPMLRHFKVSKHATPVPQEALKGQWQLASPETTGGFTAVGYFFARRLQQELQVPIGIVHTSWGGTPVEAWTSQEALASVPALKSSSERYWAVMDKYAKDKPAFVAAMDAWITANRREDKTDADPAAYTAAAVDTQDWTPVELPGKVEAPGLPEAGAVWLRKTVTVSEKPARILRLRLPIDGFDSVYWNGKLLRQTNYQNFPGQGYVRLYGPFDVPASDVNEGENILAIRLYEPVEPAVFTADPKAGGQSLSGTWLAKAEYAFPEVDAKQQAQAPKLLASAPRPKNVASYLYNGMINPIVPYAIRGAIWYQGEANAGRAYQYRTSFPLMIEDWRNQWDQGDFPFYFVQLANYTGKTQEPGESAWAELREAQSMTLDLPNTGQAVIIDLGESGDIHPRNKHDVGERLARIALAKDYGQDIPYSGPVYESMDIEDGQVVLHFSQIDGGLVAQPLPETYLVQSESDKTAPLKRNTPESELEGFAICGPNHKWVWAQARIEGDTVVVWSDEVDEPVAVRYGWANNPTCNLYNTAGLPASPFRTDDFTPATKNNQY